MKKKMMKEEQEDLPPAEAEGREGHGREQTRGGGREGETS